MINRTLLPASRIVVLLVVLLLTGQGCFPGNEPFPGFGKIRTPSGPRGILKSYDRGRTWEMKNTIAEAKKSETLADRDVTTLAIHPNDSRRLYAATDRGLWVSDNGSDAWRVLFPEKPIQGIGIDAKNDVLYISTQTTIQKSLDRGLKWPTLFFESQKDKILSDLATNARGHIFVGSTAGELLRSVDFGVSWKVINRFPGPIVKSMIHPKNESRIYVATENKGSFKSENDGQEWRSLAKNYSQQFPESIQFRSFAFDLTKPDALLYGSRYGLLKSDDGGETWRALNIIAAPASVRILTAGVDPVDGTLYYTTHNTLFKSKNSGDSWETFLLPSERPKAMVIDSKDRNIIYIGLSK